MTRYSILIILIVCIFTQCRPNKKEQTSEVNTDSLKTQLQSLNDSLQTNWQIMIDSDNLKIRHIEALLNGISKSCQYDKAAYNELLQKQTSLISKRYTNPDSLTNDQIEKYDNATDSLITGLSTFYEKSHASTCCISCDSLKQEIDKLTGDVAILRIHYDNYAKEYNALITQQKENLISLNTEYRNLKPKQIFSLMQ